MTDGPPLGHSTNDYRRPSDAAPRGTQPQHVWIQTPELGPVAGLLLEWRQVEARAWEARVLHGRLLTVDGRKQWVTVEAWVPAPSVRQAVTQPEP